VIRNFLLPKIAQFFAAATPAWSSVR